MSTSVSAQGLGSKAWYLMGEVASTAIQPWNTSGLFCPLVAGSMLFGVDISPITDPGVSNMKGIQNPQVLIYKGYSTEICLEICLDVDVVEYVWTLQVVLLLDSGNKPLFIVGSALQRQHGDDRYSEGT